MKLKEFLKEQDFTFFIKITYDKLINILGINSFSDMQSARDIISNDPVLKQELDEEYYISDIEPVDNSYEFTLYLSKVTSDECNEYYQTELLINKICENYKPNIISSKSYGFHELIGDDGYEKGCLNRIIKDRTIVSFLNRFEYSFCIGDFEYKDRACINPVIELAWRSFWIDGMMNGELSPIYYNDLRETRPLYYNDLLYFCMSTEYLLISSMPSKKDCIDNNLEYLLSYQSKPIFNMKLFKNCILFNDNSSSIYEEFYIKTIVTNNLVLDDKVDSSYLFLKMIDEFCFDDVYFDENPGIFKRLKGNDGSNTIFILEPDGESIKYACTYKNNRYIFIFRSRFVNGKYKIIR